MQADIKQILVRVPNDTKRKLRRIAADNDSSVQIVVVAMINKCLQDGLVLNQ